MAEATYPIKTPPAARDVRRQSSRPNRGATCASPAARSPLRRLRYSPRKTPPMAPSTRPKRAPIPRKSAPISAGGAPIARAEPVRPVGGGHEVEDKGDGGEETEKSDGEAADVLEVRRERVDEPGDEDQGHAGEARQDAPGESRQHDD